MRITDDKIKILGIKIKSCLKKVCFESSFKRGEGLNVSDLCRKTVPQFRGS